MTLTVTSTDTSPFILFTTPRTTQFQTEQINPQCHSYTQSLETTLLPDRRDNNIHGDIYLHRQSGSRLESIKEKKVFHLFCSTNEPHPHYRLPLNLFIHSKCPFHFINIILPIVYVFAADCPSRDFTSLQSN